MTKTERFVLILWVCCVLAVIFGCKPTTVYVDRPVIVKEIVPVPCPQPPVVKRPVLKPLPPNPTPQQVAEAALRSMAEVMGYAEQLEVLLDAYREKKK